MAEKTLQAKKAKMAEQRGGARMAERKSRRSRSRSRSRSRQRNSDAHESKRATRLTIDVTGSPAARRGNAHETPAPSKAQRKKERDTAKSLNAGACSTTYLPYNLPHIITTTITIVVLAAGCPRASMRMGICACAGTSEEVPWKNEEELIAARAEFNPQPFQMGETIARHEVHC